MTTTGDLKAAGNSLMAVAAVVETCVAALEFVEGLNQDRSIGGPLSSIRQSLDLCPAMIETAQIEIEHADMHRKKA